MDDDRLSILPDAIICHILSFLPTKHAVATSVLSKRWKPLWRSVPTLDFNDEDVDHMGTYFRFVQSVYAVILSRDIHQPITKFRLRFLSNQFYDDPANISIWVNAAVQRRVQHLDLFHYLPILQSPPNLSSIFTCKTLVVLKLHGRKLEPLSSVDLPLLKVLHLQYRTLAKFESLTLLLSGCPALEEFKTSDLCFRKVVSGFKTLPKLLRAHIFLDFFLLGVVSNVKFLHIDKINSRLVEDNGPNVFPMFHNLTHLELVSRYYDNDWSRVVELLQHCPKLQHLVINQSDFVRSKYYLFEEPKDVQYPPDVPECILSHLQRCYLNGYRGTQAEFQFAKYIMQNGRFLKGMMISTGIAENRQRKRKHKMLKKLFSCTRHSATCKLSFT